MTLAATVSATEWSADQVRHTVMDARGRAVVQDFHRLWYHTPTTWHMTRYRGIPTLKCPFDLQIYHELIHELRPTLIVETGTAYGGSALHFSDCMAMAHTGGIVVTIDTEKRERPIDSTGGIIRLHGSSIDPKIVRRVHEAGARPHGAVVLVSLDADHARDHVLAEMEAYCDMVTPGSFMVVEDTNLGGHPIGVGLDDGGPAAAVDTFLKTHPEFKREAICERYLLTMHPGGWLRRTTEETP